MNQEDKQYEAWLTKVKSCQPVLSSPDELLSTVMQRVERTIPRKKSTVLYVCSWLSGIVAGLLLILFVNETLFVSTSKSLEGARHTVWENAASDLPKNWKEMNLSEKGSYLSCRYLHYKELRDKQIMNLKKQID